MLLVSAAQATPAHAHGLGVLAPFQGTGAGSDPPLFLSKDTMSPCPQSSPSDDFVHASDTPPPRTAQACV